MSVNVEIKAGPDLKSTPVGFEIRSVHSKLEEHELCYFKCKVQGPSMHRAITNANYNKL